MAVKKQYIYIQTHTHTLSAITPWFLIKEARFSNWKLKKAAFGGNKYKIILYLVLDYKYYILIINRFLFNQNEWTSKLVFSLDSIIKMRNEKSDTIN